MKLLLGLIFGLAFGPSVAWHDAHAEKITLNLTLGQVTTKTDASETMGSYYVLAIPTPNGRTAQSLERAHLEFCVDAAADSASGIDPAPRLQVFALTADLGESFDESRLKKGMGVTSVAVGSSRQVRVDVTDVVRAWLAEPSSNHGLAIGALTGALDGRFTLRSDVLGQGVVARLVEQYAP